MIAVVLAGLSIGHWAAERLYANTEVPGRGDAVIAGALALAGITTLVAAYLRLLAMDMVDVMGGVGISSTIALSVLMFFAPSFFAGIVAPAATTLAMSGDGVDSSRVIGRMFALGAAGSILGTMTAGYVMLSFIGSFRSLLLIAGVYGVLAVLHWLVRGRLISRIA